MGNGATATPTIESLQKEIEKLSVKLDELKKSNVYIEYKKLALDKKRLERERFSSWITFLTVLATIWVAVISYSSSIDSENVKSQSAHDLAVIESNRAFDLANSEFKLKAAEILFNTENPVATYNKARAFQNLFPEQFSADFAESFNPDNYSSPSPSAKQQLITLVAEHPDSKLEIISLWKIAFPGDTWLDSVSVNGANVTITQPITTTGTSQPPSSSDTWGQIVDLINANPDIINNWLMNDKNFQKFLVALLSNEEFINRLADNPLLIQKMCQNFQSANPLVSINCK